MGCIFGSLFAAALLASSGLGVAGWAGWVCGSAIG
jgi:hypothetical protein